MIYSNLMTTLANKTNFGNVWSWQNDEGLGHRDSDVCSRCGKMEMAAHLLSCQDVAMVKVFHDSIKSMDEWMVKVDTVPEV